MRGEERYVQQVHRTGTQWDAPVQKSSSCVYRQCPIFYSMHQRSMDPQTLPVMNTRITIAGFIGSHRYIYIYL